MADNQTSAAHTVLHTPELLSLILSHLPFSSLLSATQISTHFRQQILSTPSLQRTLFLLPSLPSAVSALTRPRINLNPYLQCAFPSRYPWTWDHPNFHVTHEHYCDSQEVLRKRERLEKGLEETDFPFKSESRSWRDMLVLEGDFQIKKLRIREKVDVRSYWRSYDNWMGKWVRDRVLTFEDGMHCGDFWDLGKGGGAEVDGRRIVRLVCRSKGDRVVGLILDFKPDRWEKVSWGAWFWCLFGKKMDWGKGAWGGCLWALLGGGRRKLGGRAMRERGRLVCENYLKYMKDEEFVLDVTIKEEYTRWEHWKFWSWWEQKMKIRKLEQVGFVREADRQAGECPHW